MQIYFDSLQEGQWFKELHDSLKDAELIPINGNNGEGSVLSKALEYDRPDVILVDEGKVILVLERTIEVPTGHNVGQRFARLAAAAEAKIPSVYFGPYMARKHGGATEGPRYMNLRLFKTLDIMSDLCNTAVMTINWPVDSDCELLRTEQKDARMREFLDIFFTSYKRVGLEGVNQVLIDSDFVKEQNEERKKFMDKFVKKPEAYELPPPSVEILAKDNFIKTTGVDPEALRDTKEVVFYNVGMKYVRSDPYTGTAMLYKYLYVSGVKTINRKLALSFPHITMAMWNKASESGVRKDVRLFKHVADLIVLKDGVWFPE